MIYLQFKFEPGFDIFCTNVILGVISYTYVTVNTGDNSPMCVPVSFFTHLDAFLGTVRHFLSTATTSAQISKACRIELLEMEISMRGHV